MTAFGNIHESLSFFRNNYDAVCGFPAAIIRLHGLVDANEQGRQLPVRRLRPPMTARTPRWHEVRTPTGEQLIDPLDAFEQGDSR